VFFDIPIARQVIGFIYLTFIPGFAFMKLLKLEKDSMLFNVLFSAGFSLAILMVGGLLLNELGFAVGISKPLSSIPLITVFSGIVLLFSFLSSYKKNSLVQVVAGLKLAFRSPLIFLFIMLPLLSVLGAIWVNVYESNAILLIMIVVLALSFTIGVLFKKLLPSELYPLVILLIAISLLFHASLISNYLQPQKSDISLEYFIFKTTEEDARWNRVFANSPQDQVYGRYYSMLSITILPTIYSILLNMDSTWVLKILYPTLFSLVPLGLFYFWRRRVGNMGAFIAIFFFMAQETFYTEALRLARQMVAELFLVLLLIVVLDKEKNSFTKWISFLIFSVALVISHYGLAIIFLFLIFSSWVVSFARRRKSQTINLQMIMFFLVAMFSWYIFTSNASAFESILTFGGNIYAELGQFFDPASRGTVVLTGLGMENAPSIWSAISRAFAYLSQFLIVVGFVGILKGKVNTKIDREAFTFITIAMVLLAMLILVPGLAQTLNMTRFYHILLFFLAPSCFLGAETLVKFIFKRKTELKVLILLLTVLIPYFLFQISFVYEVTGSTGWLSVSLSKYRMSGQELYGFYQYIDAQSIFGAQWLHENIDAERTQVYADFISKYVVLTGYGMTYRGDIDWLTNATEVVDNGVVYLNRLNVVEETILVGSRSWNYSDISFLGNMNKIYSNGASEIYKG